MRSLELAYAAAALAAALVCCPAHAAPAAPLDGKSWVVTLHEEGKDAAQEDTLVFDAGTFDSLGCHEYGFGKAPYTAKREGSAVAWEASATSKSEGTNRWSGRVEGNRIWGTLAWTKEGRTITYRFEGKPKA